MTDAGRSGHPPSLPELDYDDPPSPGRRPLTTITAAGVLHAQAGALPSSIAPAIAPVILAISSGSYGVLYAVAGVCAIIGAVAILPVKRVR